MPHRPRMEHFGLPPHHRRKLDKGLGLLRVARPIKSVRAERPRQQRGLGRIQFAEHAWYSFALGAKVLGRA